MLSLATHQVENWPRCVVGSTLGPSVESVDSWALLLEYAITMTGDLSITTQQFVNWLDSKAIAPAPCPSCGSEEIAVHADSDGDPVSGVTLNKSKDGETLMYADCRIICLNCGLLRLFSAKLIEEGLKKIEESLAKDA
jgi:hypothetical protein